MPSTLHKPSHTYCYKHVGTTISRSIQMKKLRVRKAGHLLKDTQLVSGAGWDTGCQTPFRLTLRAESLL